MKAQELMMKNLIIITCFVAIAFCNGELSGKSRPRQGSGYLADFFTKPTHNYMPGQPVRTDDLCRVRTAAIPAAHSRYISFQRVI